MSERLRRKREDVSELLKAVQEEQTAIKQASPPVVINTGGSISNLNIDTPEFKKWLVDIRENINPFIGKQYLSPAPEYSMKDKDNKDVKIETMTKAMDELLKKGVADFDPEKDVVKDLEESEDIKVDNRYFERFMDTVIIENVTKVMVKSDDKDIEEKSIDKMKEYHESDNYITDVPVVEIIKNYKNLMIAQAEEKKQIEK